MFCRRSGTRSFGISFCFEVASRAAVFRFLVVFLLSTVLQLLVNSGYNDFRNTVLSKLQISRVWGDLPNSGKLFSVFFGLFEPTVVLGLILEAPEI